MMNCPKCGSADIMSQKAGYGVGKAVTGLALTGGIGLLGGFIGSNKINTHCLKCGHKWNQVSLEKKKLNDRNKVKEKRSKERLAARKKSESAGSQESNDAAQKFQRSLLLAASYGLRKAESKKYKNRISLLNESDRLKYIELTLQPNQADFDERLTASIIALHASSPDVEWEAIVNRSKNDARVGKKDPNSTLRYVWPFGRKS